jgi:hypothetical protein
MSALLKHGHVVLTPFGDNQRYDLVVDVGGRFIRIQCKTARLIKGALQFSTCSSQSHRGRGKQGYKGQAELFGVYSPDLDKVYFIGVDGVGDHGAHLRVDEPRNGQDRHVRYARDFEFKGSL